MALLTKGTLLDSLDRRLACASSVDLAVAWVTKGPALDRLIDFAKSRRPEDVRAIVGTWSHITDPDELERLDRHCRLRIMSGEFSHFHPKYYRFNNGTGAHVWIGSANLTVGGFLENTELVYETEGSAADKAWFDAMFAERTAGNDLLIAEYRARLKRNGANGGNAYGRGHCDVENRAAGRRIDLLRSRSLCWAGYVQALRQCDGMLRAEAKRDAKSPFSIYSLPVGYLATIAEGGAALHQADWHRFSRRGRQAILGLIDDKGDDLGHLGSLQAAGWAKHLFLADEPDQLEKRSKIQKALAAFFAEAPSNLPAAGQACHDRLCEIQGIGTTAATRLMALYAPAHAISVTSNSQRGLAELSGLPAGQLGNRYGDLLAWLKRQPWFGSLEPQDPFERRLWEGRAALVDAFVVGYPE
jgi:HKD family nuclease